MSETAEPDPLKTTLTAEVGEDKYEFRIPNLHDEIAIGARVRALLKKIDPTWDGFSMGFDGTTMYYLRAAAVFELLLKAATVTWPFSKDSTGAAVVDSSKFPANKATEAIKAYDAFDSALSRFRASGDINEKQPG